MNKKIACALWLLTTANIVGTITTSAQTARQVPRISYKTYCSDYGYCIDYPGLFYPQPESETGDEISFKNKMGDAILSVDAYVYTEAGQKESTDISYLYRVRLDELTNKTIVYSKQGKDFCVFTGFDKGNIFYSKTILMSDGVATATLLYPERDTTTYNQVAKRVLTNFKSHE